MRMIKDDARRIRHWWVIGRPITRRAWVARACMHRLAELDGALGYPRTGVVAIDGSAAITLSGHDIAFSYRGRGVRYTLGTAIAVDGVRLVADLHIKSLLRAYRRAARQMVQQKLNWDGGEL